VVVVAHDRRLNPDITRGSDGRWLRPPTPAVFELSFAELQRYDVGRIDPASEYARRFSGQRGRDGVRMPRLADVFDLVGSSGRADVRFNIETKISPEAPSETPSPAAFVDAVLTVVRAAGVAGRVTLQSFDWRTLRLVREQESRVAVSFLTSQQAGGNLTSGRLSSWTAGFAPGDYGGIPALVCAAAADGTGRPAAGATWSPDYRDLGADSVREAQQLGLRVLPWTVNVPADMARMIEWKVDGFITDYPDRAADLLRERGVRGT
jgi:glycerophosphoryl diester phosphodiesterase